MIRNDALFTAPITGNAAAGEGDTGCASCSRRTFLSATMLSAVAAVLASACGDGVIGVGGPTGPGGNVNLTVTLANYPALANVGGIAVLSGTSTPIAVVHTATDTYVALSLICPHSGTTVGVVGSGFRCPNHRATFAANGSWTGGQRTSSLHAFTSTLDAATGTLLITSSGVIAGNGGGDDDDDGH